ncbi:uncharacterized protein LOC119743251 [Patiria miniata]|uniref:Uncharacterized protein n=1 Tax=Patiria miniata TaxID=46514 RepID=A0A914BJG4_PATMI|nr:uncharacterized protein LOC119743251 [Patiria miniata]
MADTKTVFSTSSACRQNSKFTASIISPTTVVLTIHKSRSTSALSELQQEVRQYELATTTASSTRDGNDDSLHRSQSLPSRLRALTHHATQEAFVGSCEDGLLPGEHEGGEDTAERAESTAVASNSRVSQLEAEIQNTRMTVSTLEKTIHHMKVYIDTLERQLKDEAQNNELLKEELEASKKLCCELHEACSRGDMPSSELSSMHLVNDVASVHRSVQTLQQVEQETEPARLPDQSHGKKTQNWYSNILRQYYT